MKTAFYPQLKMDSKTIESITRFQLIPPSLVSKDNPIFSAFSKPKLRRLHMLDHHEHKNKHPDTQNYEPNPNHQNNYNSMLLKKEKQQNNMFEGLLKARKSYMKKIKLKEFYIEDYDEKKQYAHQNDPIGGLLHPLQSKNPTELNTIESRHSEAFKTNFFLPNRKKLLPARLRAKSYSNIPKNQRDRSMETQDENSLCVKAKKSQGLIETQKSASMTICYDQSAQSVKSYCRKNLRTGKIRRISQFEQKSVKGLQDITLQMNEQSIDLCSQKETKGIFQRQKRHRKNPKSQQLTKLDSVLDINPWMNNQNEDDKENQIFEYF